MPSIQITCPRTLDGPSFDALAQELSAEVSAALAKPAEYVMVTMQAGQVAFGRVETSAALVDVRSIGGLTPEACNAMTKAIATLLEKHVGLPGSRVYVTFEDVPPSRWGWNGKTFA